MGRRRLQLQIVQTANALQTRGVGYPPMANEPAA